SLLRSLYQPLIDSIFFLSWPKLKNKYSEGFDERRGIQSQGSIEKLKGIRPFWAHGVSVGEVQALMPVIRAARVSGYHGPVIISTTTETGKDMALRLGEGLFDHHIYYPWDKKEFVRKAIRSLDPWAFATAETELWPNMLWELKDASIPSFLVNGRISDRTWKRLEGPTRKKIGASVYDLFTEIFLREKRDLERLKTIGVSVGKLNVLGDTKIDSLLSRRNMSVRECWAARLGSDKYKIYVAGSTHPGEEDAALRAFEILKEKYPQTKLILAPRHPERAGDVLALARQKFSADLLSSELFESDVIVVDKIGILFELYGTAISAFVGGSFADKGGQNILEPVSWGVPVQFGPHMEDFAEASKEFIKLGIATQVNDAESLGRAWIEIMRRSVDGSGENYRGISEKYFERCSGASSKTWDRIFKYR
ncbi:MAG: 3-deoxy-D-manno-octulosonic acid transferase, partial [Synergistaceae bacterium]|nr:3-deoxy-D-manno-octulosonic acid transferase [Synergistaceae bacterium]